ncbi:MAG TPA: IS110 family transposase [Perlabentimonas sp.]|jgi:transposase|nr:IS110 family transposase [Candidatus Cloacimonadota bacterium]HLV92557.1 IS110 family transposase [Aequorivita sp.]HZJ74492.1 IS110 family transposase [Perlabentimonas sp.]
MTATQDKIEFDQVIERGCGIDIHKSVLVCTVQGKGVKTETRSYDAFTESIEQLGGWLSSLGVTHIAMESTGVYWKPVYNILEKDFAIVLVNARHLKNIPGNKTDKKDSRRIAKLLLAGLLKGSFIPPKPVREMRDLTRYKRRIIEQIASEKNRIHKFLEDANIKLSSVVSNLSGVVATKIIDAIIEGEGDPEELAKLRHGKMKASEQELIVALTGNLTDHHRFMLKVVKQSIKDKQGLINELDKQVDNKLIENEMVLDAELLSTIPGVDKEAAAYILSEIGNDMERFPDEQHLASWAGLCPGNNESAGKKKSSRTTHGDKWLKAMIVQCAWAATRTKGTYLRSKYDSLAGRRGKKRALVAVGHKVLIAAYFILKNKEPYKELGGEFLETRNREKQIKRHLQKLRDLGVDVSDYAA